MCNKDCYRSNHPEICEADGSRTYRRMIPSCRERQHIYIHTAINRGMNSFIRTPSYAKACMRSHTRKTHIHVHKQDAEGSIIYIYIYIYTYIYMYIYDVHIQFLYICMCLCMYVNAQGIKNCMLKKDSTAARYVCIRVCVCMYVRTRT